MDKDISHLTKVYIIESPSFEDIFDNRNEGTALSEILKLADIKNQVFRVSDRETLNKAFSIIKDDILTLKSSLGVINLHFSLHGSEEGIWLSDETFIDWNEFAKIVKDFNDSVGYIQLNNEKFSAVQLNFSVCNGLNAHKIDNCLKDPLFISVVGPRKEVEWTDSLLAFAIFYHNLLKKNLEVRDAIKNVNLVLNESDLFDVITGKGFTLKK